MLRLKDLREDKDLKQEDKDLKQEDIAKIFKYFSN